MSYGPPRAGVMRGGLFSENSPKDERWDTRTGPGIAPARARLRSARLFVFLLIANR